ncbi:hypothetical protein NECAME_13021 [Necator americanus]|uniref:AAA+ ATPase domain-containing protein n=1 Tax=Necator americanus TaxID=51031 RepID=W2SX60_NECAM|nr:hypothetical protein NECAME_13021 [Necator americanus]ETN74334.1 hypothetical protein NECAME_13021 [Necator americanus]
MQKEDCHTDWVSTVRFSPSTRDPVIVSAGWDKIVKVWNLGNCRLKTNHIGHTGYVSTVTVSPDGSLCASGGKDGQAMLWDLNEGKHLYTLNGNDVIHAMAFSPNRYWLCAAVGPVIKIWDLEDKREIEELKPEITGKSSTAPQCVSLAWSQDGQTLYAGYTDNVIRVWQVAQLFRELGLSEKIELNEHEMRIATQFVGGEDAGAEWGDIGILLYGPPGCGKTLLAKAVARAAGCRFINLQVSNLTDKWYGESQKLAAAVFSVAQKFQPTIIFIDEIDSFLRDRQANDHEATAMMKAQFMSLWDGFCTTDDQIIVMGATNRPQDVDPAILRRMSARFPVPVPSEKQRAQILKASRAEEVILREERLADDVDLQKIAAMGVGLSGSDLKEVCRIAVLTRAKATLQDQGNLKNRQPVRKEDLEFALMKYSRGSQQMTEYGLD